MQVDFAQICPKPIWSCKGSARPSIRHGLVAAHVMCFIEQNATFGLTLYTIYAYFQSCVGEIARASTGNKIGASQVPFRMSASVQCPPTHQCHASSSIGFGFLCGVSSHSSGLSGIFRVVAGSTGQWQHLNRDVR